MFRPVFAIIRKHSQHLMDFIAYLCIKGFNGSRSLSYRLFRWNDINKTNRREIGWPGMDWINLVHRNQWRALVNTLMNVWVP
jgi:hypothetical protein